MTKFDIRLRRKQFTQSRIERHKNYQSLMERHYEATRKKTRGMMVMVFLVILIIAILLAFFNTQEKPKIEKQIDNVSTIMTTNNSKYIDKIATVYKH
jgi:Na+/melibiose symporter-like transporter